MEGSATRGRSRGAILDVTEHVRGAATQIDLEREKQIAQIERCEVKVSNAARSVGFFVEDGVGENHHRSRTGRELPADRFLLHLGTYLGWGTLMCPTL